MRARGDLLPIRQVKHPLGKWNLATGATGLVPSEASTCPITTVAFSTEMEEVGLDGNSEHRVHLLRRIRNIVQCHEPISIAQVLNN